MNFAPQDEIIETATAIVPFPEEERRIKAYRVFAAPLDALTLDESVEALAVLSRVDSALNSKSAKSPGRLGALRERIKALMVDARNDAVQAGTHKPGETYAIVHAGVKLQLTGGNVSERVVDHAKVEALAAKLGDKAYDVSHSVDIDKIFELNQAGVISDDVLHTIVRFTRTPSLSRIEALATLGAFPKEELEAVYKPGPATPVALKVS